MSQQKDSTTLVCLFHHQDHAQAAINDLHQAGIEPSRISVIGGQGASADALENSELGAFGMPNKDYEHLKQAIENKGVVVAVSSLLQKSDVVEKIFEKHSAHQIDEAQSSNREVPEAAPIVAAPLAAEVIEGQRAIPVIEEELVVGKRAVDQGGVRVYRRVVEIPVEQNVSLREEHVVMERRPVDRAVTDTDGAFADRTIELTETAEEVVIAKSARVVEEVLVGKTSSEHVQSVHDTVRRTEVDVEEVPAGQSLAVDQRTKQ